MVVMVVVSALHLVPVDTAAVLAEPPQSCSTRDSRTVYGCHVLLLQDDQRAFLFENNFFIQKNEKIKCFFHVSLGLPSYWEVRLTSSLVGGW